ncbi:MAG: NTP transferase domain-containing protein [Chitinophagales bacterium]|nr:NTP transferase domain-containing protein [Chitinophagales bacterium]
MITTAIILAGGFGTRLQTVVKDIPKPMAPVNGKPFLSFLLNSLEQQAIDQCILSVGYKWKVIYDYFGSQFNSIKLTYCVEEAPLGTGGAIFKASHTFKEEEFFVLNGDTFFAADLHNLNTLHCQQKTLLSLVLKPMVNFDRYGVVVTNAENKIISFEEKRYYEKGEVNGGIYIMNRKIFEQIKLQEKFSFEKDLMERYYSQMDFYGFPFNDYFIDIGIPEDYQRCQKELSLFF